MEPDELLKAAHEGLMNYRLFRYTGDGKPADLNETFKLLLGRYFFPLIYLWLNCKFIDVAEVPEIRIDGKVVFQSFAKGAERGSTSPALPSPTLPAATKTDARDVPLRRDMPCRLDVNKLEPGLFESRMSYGNEEMFSDAGYPTIRAAIESSALDGETVYAVEVAYEGLVVGTYAPEALVSSAEMIAQRGVATVSSLRNY